MDWFVSVVMILFYWVNGNKWKYTWHLSICISAMWVGYAIYLKEYGLIPCNFVIAGIAVRNLLRWKRGD